MIGYIYLSDKTKNSDKNKNIRQYYNPDFIYCTFLHICYIYTS